ncbi:MAG: N-acetyltransferase family protein [Reichenbachiella sp.]|uniref:GNAT family N-acetyltransferase n=1 Tax=Reichenbachiella sp. TaxID=2184521 RepID=UPI002966B7FC|nr:GNAT family N-acetyltransferase [Reichenbachiella sp.]MDW3211791.1 N-acetyltransferase family protein [Reichenbachiella sp.]
MIIAPMLPNDWPEVEKIYQDGIDTLQATFETQTPNWEAWDAGHLASTRLVAKSTTGSILGWAALSPVSKRQVYRGVAEVSIYIDVNQMGKGIGKKLLAELIQLAEASGIWMLQAVTFPENTASVRLHEKLGFRLVGRREKIAQQHGVWRDTVLLERRSNNLP